ncbi:MAG: DUF4907 domain-containing protein [Chitinophagaceae bacterium]|nr:MAG: DUF4907 domain-containing protein [Chitinophagaceae bacterium]
MRKILMTFLLLACASFVFAQAGGPSAPKASTPAAVAASSTYAHSRLTYKIIPASNNTWCYDIYVDGRMMIHQPSVPGMPGTEGFKTRSGAEKVAQLVIGKIKKGQMPPTVEITEMKKLKAI